MDYRQNRWLLWPIMILLLVFSLDKLAFLPVYKNSVLYWKKIEPAIYQSRQDLFHQLKTKHYRKGAWKDKKLGLILGSSRSSGFDSDYIAQKIPNSYTYNFSAPFTSPAYYDYWLETLLAAGIRPDFVLLELDAAVFNAQAIDYQLSYSFDLDFVWRHTDLYRPHLRDVWLSRGKGFGWSELEAWLARHWIGFYRYPFKPGNIEANYTRTWLPDPDSALGMREIRRLDFREYVQPLIQQVNEKKLGGIPNIFFVQVPPDQLATDALHMAERDLKHFQADPTQVIFARNLLERLARSGIPVIIYMPVVSNEFYPYYKKYKVKENFNEPFARLLASIQAQYPDFRVFVRDLNESASFSCRQFQDSYHLSGPCFPTLTDQLITSSFLQAVNRN
ncbi:MAG: DUF1574 family protein [Leptospiraceae bacterium]|nr:DUF1574 family protein [Leptospiraceae bacterium]